MGSLPIDATSDILISQGFWGSYSHRGTGGNTGAIDIKTSRTKGINVYSMLSGTVVSVGGDYGIVKIKSTINGDEYTIQYMHMKSGSYSHLEPGMDVKMGDVIGEVAGRGYKEIEPGKFVVDNYAYGIHLDLQVHDSKGNKLDPLMFFNLEKRYKTSEY